MWAGYNSGEGTICIGDNAGAWLDTNTSRDGTIAIGYTALWVATTGHNTAIGHKAGQLLNGNRSEPDPASQIGNNAGDKKYGNNVFVGEASGPSTPSAQYRTVAVGFGAHVDAEMGVALGFSAEAKHFASVAIGGNSALLRGADYTDTSGVVHHGEDATTVTTAPFQVMIGPRDLEITKSSRGVVLVSPNGTRYRITVDDSGTLSAAAA